MQKPTTCFLAALAILVLMTANLTQAEDLTLVSPGTKNGFGYKWSAINPSSAGLPNFVQLSDSDSGVRDVTDHLGDEKFFPISNGEFSFPFYGETHSLIILSSNGLILFGEQYGITATSGGDGKQTYQTDCGLPQGIDPNSPSTWLRGFAFAWSDMNWLEKLETSQVLVKTFAGGECPFEAKRNESCLVVSFITAPYYVNGGARKYLGDATAILFESGDMLTQVRTFAGSTWGINVNSDDRQGLVFGIQNVDIDQGFTALNNGGSSACEAYNTYGWEDKSSLIAPGDSFQIFIAAPCAEGQREGYECRISGVTSVTPSASPSRSASPSMSPSVSPSVTPSASPSRSASPSTSLSFVTPGTKNGFGYKWSAINPSSNGLPNFVQLSSSDSGVRDVTSNLGDEKFFPISNGEFSFPFYGETHSLIILSSNGLILFGEQYGITATSGGDGKQTYQTDCGLPQGVDSSIPSTWLRGFAFAWSDMNWLEKLETSQALVKTFVGGECPFEAKRNESCLVVSFITAPYYVNGGARKYLGDATAILFESGDMLTQVRTCAGSTWGINVNSDDTQGLVFGIQNVDIDQGFTMLNNSESAACEAYNTYGWEDKSSLIVPGDSFQIFIAAPCAEGQREGYECRISAITSVTPSTSPSRSASPSVSPSVSPSMAPSTSASSSASPSVSPSVTPSASPSRSASPSISPSMSLSFVTPTTKNGFGYKWSAINPSSAGLPNFVQLSSSDSGVHDVTSNLGDEKFFPISNGEFSFPFYGETHSLIILSSNGIILFGEQYGLTATIFFAKETWRTDCSLPQTVNAGSPSTWLRGFAFAWSDFDWGESFNNTKALTKIFEKGACPFAPKFNESCLVVSLTSVPYYRGGPGSEINKSSMGDVTVILFESGDMLTQVRTFEDSAWGVNIPSDSPEIQGLVFGIQSVAIDQGFTMLNNGGSPACEAYNTYGWEDKSSLIVPGDSFQIFVAAPCAGGREGYECRVSAVTSVTPSASPSSSASPSVSPSVTPSASPSSSVSPSMSLTFVTPGTKNGFGYKWSAINPSFAGLPNFVQLSSSASGVRDVTSNLGDEKFYEISNGEFSFPFYGETHSLIILSSNGIILFGEQYGITASSGGDGKQTYQTDCGLPQGVDPNSPSTWLRGFAFAWSDMNWLEKLETSQVLVKTFVGGECPFEAKRNESCLVVSFITAPYYVNGGAKTYLGDATAILFESGDMLTQVRTFAGSTWGINVNSDDRQGLVFGIQSVAIDQGFTALNNGDLTACEAYNTYGWEDKSSLIVPGDSFQIFIAAPCAEGQREGYECRISAITSVTPSASPSRSASPSISPSVSPSVAPSTSASSSASPSVSPSVTPSASPSRSVSPSISPSMSLTFVTPGTKNGFGYKWSAINPSSAGLPNFVQLSSSDSGVLDLTSHLGDEVFYPISNGEFSFPFYGETHSLIILSSNGIILFGEQYGITATNGGDGKETYQTDCSLPQSIDPANPSTWLRGFAFAWSDMNWLEKLETSKVLVKTFVGGECPFEAKRNESCLVVSFITAPYYVNGGAKTFLGDATAILFESGDMLTQVRTFAGSTWGVYVSSEIQGLVFGIQNVDIDQGFTALNNGDSAACEAYNTYGWEDKSSLIVPGDSFQIFIAAPCAEGQREGYECRISAITSVTPSASPSRSASPSISPLVTPSASPSRSASPSLSPSMSPSASPSRSASPSTSLSFVTPGTKNGFGYKWSAINPSSNGLPNFVQLSSSASGVRDVTSNLGDEKFFPISNGEFSFPFYGETHSLIILSSNGLILFGEQYGITASSGGDGKQTYQTDCGLPQGVDPNSPSTWLRGFAFAWSDMNWLEKLETSQALVKTFVGGECPFEAKRNESCLVVSFITAPYYVNGGARKYLGDATAILFESGDMLTQVRTFAGSTWGINVNSDDRQGLVFGIQNVDIDQGFTMLNNGGSSACEAYNTYGWEDKSSLIVPGDSFQIFIAAPCAEGQREGYECRISAVTPVTPSASPSRSVSPSISPSISPSVSPSVTLSASPSRSVSSSVTSSASPSRSVSPSVTPSASSSRHPSVTPTSSVTPSTTRSPTPSTSKVSPTSSPTSAISMSPTQSTSVTNSPTQSAVASVSMSSSATRTPTQSATPSASGSPTRSPTASSTQSPTPSLTHSASRTPQLVNGTLAGGDSGGGSIGIIAAGIVVPVVLAAVATALAAAALLYWRSRKRPNKAVTAPFNQEPGIMAPSPIYEDLTTTFSNDLYAGGADTHNAPRPGGVMAWEAV